MSYGYISIKCKIYISKISVLSDHYKLVPDVGIHFWFANIVKIHRSYSFHIYYGYIDHDKLVHADRSFASHWRFNRCLSS